MKNKYCLGVMDLEHGMHEPNPGEIRGQNVLCIECGLPIDKDTLDVKGVA